LASIDVVRISKDVNTVVLSSSHSISEIRL